MKKMLLVIWREVKLSVFCPSFFAFALLFPLIPVLMTLYLNTSVDTSEMLDTPVAVSPAGTTTVDHNNSSRRFGYVDLSGLVTQLPSDIDPEKLKPFTDPAQAHAALETGEIDAFYIIPADYLSSRRISYMQRNFNLVHWLADQQLIRWTLEVNLLGGDEATAGLLEDPVDFKVESKASLLDPTDITAIMEPTFTAYTYLFILMFASSLLLAGVTKERENRVLEILLTSVSTSQFLIGKMIALGFVGLLQFSIWAAVFRFGQMLQGEGMRLQYSFSTPQNVAHTPGFLAWAVVFYILGYTLYAAIMAGIGALVPNLREGSQVAMVIILPMTLPIMTVMALAEEPRGPLGTILGLVPVTAPVANILRLGLTPDIPPLELALSASLLLLSSIVTLYVSIHLFRTRAFGSRSPWQSFLHRIGWDA